MTPPCCRRAFLRQEQRGRAEREALRTPEPKGKVRPDAAARRGDFVRCCGLPSGDVRMIAKSRNGLKRRNAPMRSLWNLVLLLTLASGVSLVAAQTTQHASPGDPASASRAPDLTKLRLNYIVAGPDRSLIRQFKAGLSKRLRSIGVDVTNRFPAATLILYVMQDVNSSVNKSGVTIAIAYVSNAWTYQYALGVIKKRGALSSPILKDMLQQKGFLMRLNTAHLDKPTAKSINALLDIVVTELLRKVGIKNGQLLPGDSEMPRKLMSGNVYP